MTPKEKSGRAPRGIGRLQALGILIGLTSLSIAIYVNFFRPQKIPQTTVTKAKTEILQDFRNNKEMEELTMAYQNRLANSTPENDVVAATTTLHDLKTLSNQYVLNQDPMATWRFAEDLANPEYLEALREAGFVEIREVKVDTDTGIDQPDGVQRRWRVSYDGNQALTQNDFSPLRKVMKQTLQEARHHGITVSNLLYARYWGVGRVTDTSYDSCNAWNKGEDVSDNRIDGFINVHILAGIVWRRRPYRAGEDVYVQTEHDVGIFGCPKRGDIVGYVEYPHAEMWEKIFVPPHQRLIR